MRCDVGRNARSDAVHVVEDDVAEGVATVAANNMASLSKVIEGKVVLRPHRRKIVRERLFRVNFLVSDFSKWGVSVIDVATITNGVSQSTTIKHTC